MGRLVQVLPVSSYCTYIYVLLDLYLSSPYTFQYYHLRDIVYIAEGLDKYAAIRAPHTHLRSKILLVILENGRLMHHISLLYRKSHLKFWLGE